MPGRLRIAVRLLTLLLIVGGILSAALGLFAFTLGLDNDPGWGRGRTALAAAGAAMLICAASIIQRSWLRQTAQAVASSPVVKSLITGLCHILRGVQASRLYQRMNRVLSSLWQRLAASSSLGWLQRIFAGSGRQYALLAAGVTLLVYVWYMTAGTWTTWTPYSRYFDRQANAFLAGPDMRAAQQRFALDYWGLAYRQGLDYILKHDAAARIPVLVETEPGRRNAAIFPTSEEKRLDFVSDISQASYFVSNYNREPRGYGFENEIYTVEVGSAPILSVYQLTEKDKR